jgi:predicted transposase YbfD/YdcC
MVTEKSLTEFLDEIEDPRVRRTRLHPLINILVIAVSATLCGAEGWDDMVEFADCKLDWLQERLDMTNGIPCADTFRRVFARLDGEAFSEMFLNWVGSVRAQSVSALRQGVVAIDGKTLRHSFDSATSQSAIHMVSAFASEARLVLAQTKVDAKSNEIAAVEPLLALLDLKGCVVTADAMHCQKETAARIISKQADYVLAVKDNQKHLREDVEGLFGMVGNRHLTPLIAAEHVQINKDHGRIETRTCRQIDMNDLGDAWQDIREQWAGLRSVAKITSSRTIAGETNTQTRFYISSMPADPKRLLAAVRSHWSIENSLHHVLDVSLNEDACRIRKDNAPRNLATIRHIALNLIRQETTSKRGVKARQKRAGWDSNYLDRLIAS